MTGVGRGRGGAARLRSRALCTSGHARQTLPAHCMPQGGPQSRLAGQPSPPHSTNRTPARTRVGLLGMHLCRDDDGVKQVVDAQLAQDAPQPRVKVGHHGRLDACRAGSSRMCLLGLFGQAGSLAAHQRNVTHQPAAALPQSILAPPALRMRCSDSAAPGMRA